MLNNKKDLIAIISACVMLVFAIGLCIAGFIVSPVGQVDNSVLWIFGQCLLYAGSILGIGIYVNGKMTEIKDQINNFINKK